MLPAKTSELGGRLIEKAPSVDNVFGFALLFSSFDAPARYQHKVLFRGIFGTPLRRAIGIGVVVLILGAPVLASLLGPRKEARLGAAPEPIGRAGAWT